MSVVLLAVLLTSRALAAGIPEPGLVLYGVVQQVDRGQTNRLTTGTLECRIRPSSGTPITLRTNLQNINDQFSYVLIVPFETRLTGMTLSEGALELLPTGTSYARAASIDGSSARFVISSSTNFTFGPLDRGRLERVDLVISNQPADSDGNGLPDAWEMAHFGRLGVDPQADPDRDGLSNRQEYVAGTDPSDPQSAFRFIAVTHEPPSGVLVQWASVADRSYTLLRSTELLGAYTIVSSNLVATPPVNSFRDPSAGSTGSFFYKLRVENP